MAEIITCECGAKVRLPEETLNRSFRCPACKTALALTVDARVLHSVTLGAGAAGVTCPICQCEIGADEAAVTCPGCDQVHHRECWSTIGGCGTYGCQQAPSLSKSSGPEQAGAPLGWGDTKKCPRCGEEIKASAMKCRHCRLKFETVDPLTPKELKRRQEQKAAAEKLRLLMPALFLVSLPGCLAPVVLLVGSLLLVYKGKEMRKAGPVYLVLGYSAVIVSAVYSLLMLGFLAYSIANQIA